MKTHIIIHHSLTPDSVSKSWAAIRKYHMETNGWQDIGYHYGIENVDGKYEIMKGRAEGKTGAHTKELNMNKVGLGICLVGNFDRLVPAAAQWSCALGLVRQLMAEHHIPRENVWGHREAQEKGGLAPEHRKTCPGKAFNMDLFRSSL